ncbi:hypothetical protein GGR54DRAFT_642291 [Hypoxylon sp. NC1633]|nr:hypothetical protein GGR54DRAFT_642291 [Hypoxylon sp. NC1633]
MATEDTLQRRRERGRRSQAGFRKRQAEANRHIRDQNLQLRAAIEKLIDAPRGYAHPELVNAIFDVAAVAGIDAQQRTPADAGNVQPMLRDVSGNVQLLMPPADSEEDMTIDFATREYTRGACDPAPASSSATSTTPSSASPRRVNCGIFLDPLHYMRISVPPEDIVPYLGPGSKTFAGILFWSMMDHSQSKCARKHTEISTLIQSGLGHSKTTEGWAITYIQAMVEARQEYKRTGSISPQYASAAEPDLGIIVRDRIEEEYKCRGMDPSRWLSARGIENRVKGIVDGDTFAILETAARGKGDPSIQSLFDTLKCNLSETCICFGDGPRWNVDIIDGLFLDWVHMALGFMSRINPTI